MTPPIYQLNQIAHHYHNNPSLQIENLSITAGSIVGLIGPNGSGKSTLLKLLGFVERPSKGKIIFNGKAAEPFSDEVRFHVTLLTQEPYLMKRSVFDNIFYGLKIRHAAFSLFPFWSATRKASYQKEIDHALSLVGLSPEAFRYRRWNELSGGEAQRVALAARLVLKPKVLLLDEPTASVDVASAQLIKEASMNARQEWGTTLVIASHDWNWLYDICDQVFHLFRGHILDNGMENILFGPWLPRSDGNWEKRLQDGQSVIVSRPPNTDAIAMIGSDAISFCSQDYPKEAYQHKLNGNISRLILEKSSQQIIATVMVSNLSFTVRLTQEQVHTLRLYPGQQIIICYDFRSVKWH